MGAILLMLNNYCHDLATAVLFVLSLGMFFLVKEIVRNEGNKDFVIAGKRIFKNLSAGAAVSFLFIIILGIPRYIFFSRFELWDAAKKGIVAALIFKHILLFAVVSFGIFYWLKLQKKIKAL